MVAAQQALDRAERVLWLCEQLALHPAVQVALDLLDYATEERAGTAKNMLRYSEMTASAIATSLGFSSQSYFTRVFRERTGFTPSEFRKRFFRESEMGGT